jgi:hypothetical protein
LAYQSTGLSPERHVVHDVNLTHFFYSTILQSHSPRKSQGEKKFFGDIVNRQMFKKSGFLAVTKAIFELARDVVQQTELN